MEFLLQVRLLLFSLRKNGGRLASSPVTLITVGEGLPKEQRRDFEERYAPIEFEVAPRLGGTPHTNKMNAFFAIELADNDVLLYFDCDTVVRGPLDGLLGQFGDGAEFVCRRGGDLDRNRFVDFGRLVRRYAPRSSVRVRHEGISEFPMFNSGVFLATGAAVRRIRGTALEFCYELYERWRRLDQIERILLPFKLSTVFLYRFRFLRGLFRARLLTRQDVIEPWTIEQGALALACMATETPVAYLDERDNSWGGDDDFRVLHCFKSTYQFERGSLLDPKTPAWIEEYREDEIPGRRFLAQIVTEFRRAHGVCGTG